MVPVRFYIFFCIIKNFTTAQKPGFHSRAFLPLLIYENTFFMALFPVSLAYIISIACVEFHAIDNILKRQKEMVQDFLISPFYDGTTR